MTKPTPWTTFNIGSETYAVTSWPASTAQSPLPGFTPAETEVALLAVQGLSNAAIASRRGTRERTVANQLAAIFRKLHIASRAELPGSLAALVER